MRLSLACTSALVCVLVGTPPALANPQQPTSLNSFPWPVVQDPATPARVPHPVVYLDKPDTDADAAATKTKTPAASSSAERVPHPVVYDTDQAKQQATEPETEPAVLPPNPDLDTSESEAAAPAQPDAPQSPETQEVATDAAQESSPVAEVLAAAIQDKRHIDVTEATWTALEKAYAARNHAPAWIGKTGVTKAGRKLISALETADQWGLDPKQFAIPAIADASDGAEPLNLATWAELEMKLTGAALRYANHARGGRIENPTEQLSSYIDRKPQLKEPGDVLAAVFNATDPSAALEALHPRHPQFERLRQKYLDMRAAAEQPHVVRIPRGPLLRKGTRHPHVALLRKRLKIEAVAPEDGSEFDPELFDDAVFAAVKTFQSESGISTDGLVGNGTRRSLNDIAVPDTKKILANMEQWRWMPDDLGDVHVMVNIPEYKVRVIRDGEVIHEERVITGKLNKQTPLFSDVIETLYFHPKWHVPDSIKVQEIYPSLARGGGYFRSQNLRIAYNGRPVNPYSLDWSNRDIRRYHVYQPPGRGNVLGVVKFTFPNKHMVYMHDTPTKHLFKTKQRTHSHGCVRVRNPVRLAELILEASNGMSPSDIEQILRGPLQETPVKLDQKIPVHLTYFTAWVDEDGQEHAVRDIYGHENKIKLALAGRFDKIAVGPDHLAPVKYKPRQQYTGTTALEDFFKNLFPGF